MLQCKQCRRELFRVTSYQCPTCGGPGESAALETAKVEIERLGGMVLTQRQTIESRNSDLMALAERVVDAKAEIKRLRAERDKRITDVFDVDKFATH